MHVNDILQQLTYYDDLPKYALRAATESRADLVPVFLQQIEEYVNERIPSNDPPEFPIA